MHKYKNELVHLIMKCANESNINSFNSSIEDIDFSIFTVKDFNKRYDLKELELIYGELQIHISEICKRKNRNYQKHNHNTIKQDKNFNLLSNRGRRGRKHRLVDDFIQLGKNNNVKFLRSFDEIDFSVISSQFLIKKYTVRELEILYDELTTLVEVPPEEGSIDIGYEPISQLEVIEKYNDLINYKTISKETNQVWRKYIPGEIKSILPNWNSAPANVVYDTTKEHLKSLSGDKRNSLFDYLVDLSDIVFTNENNKEFEVEDLTADEISDLILGRVEAIILPHQEIISRMEECKGKLIFTDASSLEFSEKLKQEIIDRDNGECIICKSTNALQYHHKIPVELGGNNHIQNIVTLCAPCVSGVKSVDVEKAFNICLANFMKKNKASCLEL